jgi:hypothetical protein
MVRNVTHADQPACIHRQQDIERFVPTFGDTSTETKEKFAKRIIALAARGERNREKRGTLSAPAPDCQRGYRQ